MGKGDFGENDFRGYGSGLRVCHWHGDNNDHRADHVIKTLLPRIHRGFISASDNPIRIGGPQGFRSGRSRNAKAIIDFPHRNRAFGCQCPGDHEQRLQEQPT